MVTIGRIPVFNAILGEDCGMMRISLVDDPAVMSLFQAFDAERPMLMYKVASEEQRKVLGVVMRADFPIYRRSEDMGEFYIIYNRETIEAMAQRYLAEGRANKVNIMHQADSEVNGVEMLQYFLKDTTKGIAPEGFEDIADGSLFAEFKVDNDAVWDAIKEGVFKGFSLEGYFDLEPSEDGDAIAEIVRNLKGNFKRLFKHSKDTKEMSKINKILTALAKAVAVEFKSVATDKGVLNWDTEEDLKAGDEVFAIDENGERSAIADGEYATEDGKVIVVVESKVAEIKDAEAEVAPEAPVEDEEAKKKKCGMEGEEPTEEEAPKEDKTAELEQRVADLEALVAKMADFIGIEGGEPMPEQMSAIRAEMEAIKKAPLATPAHEEFKKEVALSGNGDKRTENLLRIINAR